MYTNRELTEEDYEILPCYAKAYGCECGGQLSSSFISCTPSCLRFPHDQPSKHLQKIVVWNKTPKLLELAIEEPKSKIFHVFYDKMNLHGGAQTTIFVQCTPGDRKIAFDCLRIKINRKETVSLPLQLFPSFNWFVIPRLIVMPHVAVGNSAEIRVILPKVVETEKFFISIRTPETDSISVTPFHGILGGSDGVQELLITYNPKEFITIVYVIQIHFPGVDPTPHDIIVFARCIPGLESELLMKETAEIESLKPKTPTRKYLEPRMRFRQHTEIPPGGFISDDDEEDKEDLTKPAGVVHFLLKKGGKLHEHSKTIGPLGLTTAEEQKVYRNLEKDFHDAINREKIRQKNIPNQNNKAFYGSEPVENQPEFIEKIVKESEQQTLQYEKALGLSDNLEEDTNRTKLKVSHQRSLRRVGEELEYEKPDLDADEIAKIQSEGRSQINRLALTRFIQAVYVVMARYRVSKRIPKLRILQTEIKSARKKAAADATKNLTITFSEGQVQNAKPGFMDDNRKTVAGGELLGSFSQSKAPVDLELIKKSQNARDDSTRGGITTDTDFHYETTTSTTN